MMHSMVSVNSILVKSQLILPVQDLAKGLNGGEQIDALLLDFSKAFNKVPHKQLLENLCHYGTRDSLNQCIADFPTDRQQEVVLEGVHSKATNVTSGVPQGTVLRPLFFLVYVMICRKRFQPPPECLPMTH